MLRNKKLVYILLPLALIIWGLIFYKILSHFKKPPDINPILQREEIKPSDIAATDTMIIVANYRDPFLSTLPKVVSKPNAQITGKPSVPNRSIAARRVKKLKWPKIEYGGVVDNKEVRKIALVKINNRKFLMQKGDKTNEVEVLEIFSDSIKLMYRTEYRTITK
jgi:hypothetical protein